MFIKIRKRFNLPAYLTCHKLRHVFASSMAEKGVSIKAIADLLGHARSSDVAEMIYIELSDDILIQATNQISYK
jgi:site-specific recombinase XerD